MLHTREENKSNKEDEQSYQSQYVLEYITQAEDSPLKGKNLFFLGSSVTYGAASGSISFVDYIAARNGCNVIKEAVSGTTLVEEEVESYIARLKRVETTTKIDMFVCQLSTNDAMQGKILGRLSDSECMADFNSKTVAGAIEYIISYVRKTWNCPIVFFTNPLFESEKYGAMVELLKEIRCKWDILIIDLWNDKEFNSITPKQRRLFMADAVHPTQAGYLKWWTPIFEENLYKVVEKTQKF